MKNLRRNAAFNVLGWALPTLIFLGLTPVMVNKLGLEAFGIVSLIQVVTGYMNVLNFGFSEAIIKQVAASFEKDRAPCGPRRLGRVPVVRGLRGARRRSDLPVRELAGLRPAEGRGCAAGRYRRCAARRRLDLPAADGGRVLPRRFDRLPALRRAQPLARAAHLAVGRVHSRGAPYRTPASPA